MPLPRCRFASQRYLRENGGDRRALLRSFNANAATKAAVPAIFIDVVSEASAHS
jgi:hypothetical protein